MATKTKSAKATREEKLAALRFLWERGNAATLAELWSMQDGYGVPGFMPEQGYDWSGVRDSSDAAVDAMFAHFFPWRA